MAYLTEISKPLSDQLTKFATFNRHQLAGQVANLDFWCGELRNCLEVLDGYKARFERMKNAQVKYAAEHKTIEFDLDDPCCCRGPAQLPKRIDHRVIAEARQSLCDAMHRFLARCLKDGLIDETRFNAIVGDLAIAAGPDD